MYLSEIAPFDYRGAFGTVHQLLITGGIFLSSVFGLKELLGMYTLSHKNTHAFFCGNFGNGLQLRWLAGFLPARRYARAGLCDSDVSVCLSVRLSVCHTPVLCLAQRKQDREMYTV